MKKILLAIFMLIGITACDPEESFKGNEYILNGTPNGVKITLGFAPAENRFFGKAVNNYFGTYQINKNDLSLGTVGSTMMMGPKIAMEAEQKYLQDLSLVKTFKLTPTTLTLMLSNQQELVFTKSGKTK